MDVRIFLEHRFQQSPDGNIWSALYGYDVWKRYFSTFDRIVICARVGPVDQDATTNLHRVDGDRVSVDPLPLYQGPAGFLRSRGRFRAAVRASISHRAAYIVRVPGNVANEAIAALRANGTPYAVEVVADPWDMFSPGAIRHPLRPFFRRWFRRCTQRQCFEADASLYVTEYSLQRRYPPRSNTYTCGVSDVVVDDEAFVTVPRTVDRCRRRPIRLVCVGSFNLLYKAQDIMVKALDLATARGLDAEMKFIGDGVYRPVIQRQVENLPRIRHRVHFAGQLRAGADVRDALDHSEMFVLPSRQEGLPRAVVEAMARGVPCLGTNVGGFPELLPPDGLVSPNDFNALADRLCELALAPERLAALSASGLRRARDFHRSSLAPLQEEFFRAVRSIYVEH